MSKHAFNFSDLMYNHENWRDIGKSKEVTRTESQKTRGIISQQETYHIYLIEKAKDKIKRPKTCGIDKLYYPTFLNLGQVWQRW